MVKPKEFVPLQDTFKQINHLFVDFSTTINIFFRNYENSKKNTKPFAFHNVISLKMPGNRKSEFVSAKWISVKQKITKDDYKLKPEGVSVGKQSELPQYLHKVHRANYIAMGKYILPQYPGKLHLFRALDQKFYIKDPAHYGWDKFVKEVVILDIPGEHSTIFAPPNDELFAKALQKCLDERE